jgi:hypothetical protein
MRTLRGHTLTQDIAMHLYLKIILNFTKISIATITNCFKKIRFVGETYQKVVVLHAHAF